MNTTSLGLDMDYITVTLLALVPLLVTLGIFYFGFFRLPQTRVTTLFSVFQIALLLWQLNDVLLRTSSNIETAQFCFNALYPLMNFMVPLGFHLAMVYTGQIKKAHQARLKFFLYAPAVFFALAAAGGFISNHIVPSATWRWIALPNENVLTLINTIWMSAVALATLGVLVRFAIQMRTDAQLGRQSMILALGFTVPALQGIFTEAIFPYVFHVNPVPLTSSFMSAFSVSLIFVLTRFDLLSYSPKQSWRHIVREMNEGILIVDTEENIRFANPRFCEMTRYRQKDLMGKSVRQLLLPEWEREKVGCNLEKRKQGISNRYEVVLITSEKKQIVCEVSGSPQYDKSGKVIGSVAILTDITDRKLHEMELHKKHLETLQYQSMLLSAQINPHFIFNSLNSVQYYVINQEVEPALDYISEFSQLIRAVLANSMNTQISLADEIKFLKLYLKLEQRRFGNKFGYEIYVDPTIDTSEISVPPMLLQPYLENSVVHGVGQLESDGKIEIRFELQNKQVVCIIEDNGVGRDKARELKVFKNGYQDSQSAAMSVTAERLQILNELGKHKYQVVVNDLVDSYGDAAGTRAEVIFPLIRAI